MIPLSPEWRRLYRERRRGTREVIRDYRAGRPGPEVAYWLRCWDDGGRSRDLAFSVDRAGAESAARRLVNYEIREVSLIALLEQSEFRHLALEWFVGEI